MSDVPITRELIEAGASGTGGWNAAQLAILGVPWPPPHGWRYQLEHSGATLSEEQAEQFLSLKGAKRGKMRLL